MLIHIKVVGRVQGVGFRSWARREAITLGISGWVRNRINGSVEILAEGADENVRLFLKACQTGPSWSRVDRLDPVTIPDAPILPIEKGFFQIEATV